MANRRKFRFALSMGSGLHVGGGASSYMAIQLQKESTIASKYTPARYYFTGSAVVVIENWLPKSEVDRRSIRSTESDICYERYVTMNARSD